MTVLNEIEFDFKFYTIILYDKEIEEKAKKLIDIHQLKSLLNILDRIK